jgi:ketosteroid isomerase-like protein
MWKPCTFLILLSMALRLCAQGALSSDTGQGRILALENAWDQAVRQKDTAALEMLLAPDLIYVDYDGKLMDKTQYLASVQAPAMRPTRVVSESINVHLYGAAAVVSGVYRETGVTNGKPYALRERFMDTWVRSKESWVCVASQSTSIPQ